MELLGEIGGQILPLYGLVVAGFLIKKYLRMPEKWVSKPLIYVLLPPVIFHNIATADAEYILLIPGIVFVLSLVMNLPARLAHRTFAHHYEPNLLACAFAFFNIAFFGIPTVRALFGAEGQTVVISAYIGNALYGDTIGFYQVARTQMSKRAAATKVFKIPAIYAFVLAGLAQVFEWQPPAILDEASGLASKAVSVLGMLIIGMGVSRINFRETRYGALSKILLLRAVSAGVVLSALLLAEKYWLGVLDDESRRIVALLPLFPVAANVSVFASFLGTQEKDAATLVAFSALLSLILVPLVGVFLA